MKLGLGEKAEIRYKALTEPKRLKFNEQLKFSLEIQNSVFICSSASYCHHIVTPSIIDQEHTIEHAVKKEYSCITSNLVTSRIPNLKKWTKYSIHIYVDLYEKTDGQTAEQRNKQMKRQTDILMEE